MSCQSTPVDDDDLLVASTQVQYAWTQFTQDNQGSARAILASPNASCPTITLDNNPSATMTARTIPSNYTGFVNAITVCEFSFTFPVSQITIDNAGTPLSLPGINGQSDNILVLGDTGCRLKGSSLQWCAGGSITRGMWGFPQISTSASSQSQPDFILHVGDYNYRENVSATGTACDPFDQQRGWVHCGDNWPTWQDDFFAPSSLVNNQGNNLLTRAPWLFVRGNHEDCNRAGQGYYLFFYSGQAPSNCDSNNQTNISPYRVALTNLDIYVADTSAEDSSYAQQSFSKINHNLTGSTKNVWLTTHLPMEDLGSAFANSGLAQQTVLKWIHVGHVHLFQHNSATSMMQAETISGGGGTKLDSCGSGLPICSGGIVTTPTDQGCCYGKVSSHDAGQYSYSTVKANSNNNGWVATLHDINGTALYQFSVQ